MDNKCVFDFLSNNLKHVSLAKIIKDHNLFFGDLYDKITTINARNTNTFIGEDNLLNISKTIYDFWYDYLHEMNSKKIQFNHQDKLNTFLNNDFFRKENMDPEKCFEFFANYFDRFLLGVCSNPMQFQHDNAYQTIYEKKSDFIHCQPFGSYKDVTCRLYININPQNMGVFCEKILKKCFDEKCRLYFKFWTDDNRNDTFLIYANYNNIQKIVDILKQIKKEAPELFVGCDKMNPMLYNIDNFIGFGEEPYSHFYSFNSIRADAIERFLIDKINPVLMDIRKMIANYQGEIKNSANEVLNLEDYIAYYIEKSFKNTIFNHQRDIKQNIIPYKYLYIGDESVESYKAIENRICRECLIEIPAYIKNYCKLQAKKVLKSLKDGLTPEIEPLVFKTKDINLFSDINRAKYQKILDKGGYLDYKFNIDIDIEDKLFKVFNVNQQIKHLITDDKLKPYLKKYRISSNYIYINKNTEKIIEDVLDNKKDDK